MTELEKLFQAITFLFIDAMIKAGEELGLSHDKSTEFTVQTFIGAAEMLRFEHPEELRKQVTSPGGTTQDALDVLMDKENGLEVLIRKAVGAE